MALNGINLPLAVVGIEAVWQNTLKKFNFSDEEISSFICGPSYFAWWLMGNLEGAGGPLPQSWINDRVELQKKILTRMRELGMDPVFPAFYGMVPNLLKEKYPDADIRDQGYWVGGYKRPAFLMPTDSLYKEMGEVFYEEQAKLFGKTRFFSGDPFHEGGKSNGIDVGQAGKNVHNLMEQTSKDAVWVLQGWGGNPSDKLISRLDKEDVLILDLAADATPAWENRNGWSGYPWVFSIIENFGGKPGVFGMMPNVANNLVRALNTEEGGNLVGVGSAPEGIENNPLIFEFIYDMRWRTETPDMEQWINDYTIRRYGKDIDKIKEAWQILYHSVYSKGTIPGLGTSESIICARPSLNINSSSSWGTNKLEYNPMDLVTALDLLVQVSPQLKQSESFKYDLVDFTRQTLTNLAQKVYDNMIIAFENKNQIDFNKWSNMMLQIIDDQNRLVGSRKEFLVGEWIRKARESGYTQEEKALYEHNARALIATWSFHDSDLRDYAHREYAGMLKDYYKPRWNMFIEELNNQLNEKSPQQVDYYAIEKNWVESNKTYTHIPEGNSVSIVQEIFKKYKPIIEKVY